MGKKALSWPWWRLVLTGLNILALVLSAIISWHYIAGGSMAGCGGDSPCQHVLNSHWSVIAGILPVSGLALGVYSAFLAAVFFTGPAVESPVRILAWRVILILAGSIAGSAIWFTIVQKWIIREFCPYCMAAHITGIVLAVLVIWRSMTDSTWRLIRPSSSVKLVLGGVVLAGIMAFTQYVLPGSKNSDTGSSQEIIPVPDYNDVPLIGSTDALYVVILLYDYECSHCQRIHFMLDEAVQLTGGRVAFALCPAPLNSQCNPYIPVDTDTFRYSCELARISLAVWFAERNVFPAFDNWMFTYESGDRWSPRSPEAARSKAVELVGQAKYDSVRNDPRIGKYLEESTHIYGRTIVNGRGGIPKMIFGSRWVIPEPGNAEELLRILRESLGINGI